MKRLLAYRDVHLLAPGNKSMTGRTYLDAIFVQKPTPPAPPPGAGVTKPGAANAEDIAVADSGSKPAENEAAAQEEQEEKKPAEPAMVGSADRIWVKIEMTPKPPEQDVRRQESCHQDNLHSRLEVDLV